MSEIYKTPYIHHSIASGNPRLNLPKSPLRYPGGKARAVKQILKIIPAAEEILVSPFFGGGSVEIAASHLGKTVIGYDIFTPLVDFWIELLQNPDVLANKVMEYFPLSKSRFYDLQKMSFTDRLENAAVFYVLNRSSFGGSTLSGGMSPGHPRFTESSIDYLRNFQATNLSVSFGDFHETIVVHNNTFLYLDPPYLIENSLYGKNGDTHKGFDHEGLCTLLQHRDKWVLSYNDSRLIRDMYKKFRFFKPQWKYGMSADKESRELLIISNDLPELVFDKDTYQMRLF
jgi:DNA adenine methylase